MRTISVASGRSAPDHGRVPVLDVRTVAPTCGGVHRDDGRGVLARCHLATSPLARTVGLLGTRWLPPELGLLIPRCTSVHTVGMRRPITCVWIGRRGRVLRVDELVLPWRLVGCAGAIAVVELGPRVERFVRPGDVLCSSSPAIRRAVGRDSDEKCGNCEERVPRKGGGSPPGCPSAL